MWACALNICSPPKLPAWAKLAAQEASSGCGLAWSSATAIIKTNKFCTGNHISALIWPRCSESSAGLSLILKLKILWRGTQASKKTLFFLFFFFFFWWLAKLRLALRMQLCLWRQIRLEFGPLAQAVYPTALCGLSSWMNLKYFFRKLLSWEHAKANVIFLKPKSLLCSAGIVISLIYSWDFQQFQLLRMGFLQIFGFIFLEAMTKEVNLEIYNLEVLRFIVGKKGLVKASSTSM